MSATLQRPRPPCHCGLLGLLPKLHRSDQSSLSTCSVSGRPFPYGQEYLGTPEKIAVILPQAGQGERGSPAGCSLPGIGQEVVAHALESPQEARQSLCGGQAGSGRTGTRG